MEYDAVLIKRVGAYALRDIEPGQIIKVLKIDPWEDDPGLAGPTYELVDEIGRMEPCPFCGKVNPQAYKNAAGDAGLVKCAVCYARYEIKNTREALLHAIAAWNQRAGE